MQVIVLPPGANEDALLASQCGLRPAQMLAQAVALAHQSMQELNQSARGIPVQDATQIEALLLHRHATTFLAILDHAVVGVAVAFKGFAHFPDAELVPEPLRGDEQQQKSLVRLTRLFVDRSRVATARCTDQLLRAVFDFAKGGTIIGIVIEDIRGEYSRRQKSPWMIARAAFKRTRAFAPTGFSFEHSYTHADGCQSVVQFAWYASKPASTKEVAELTAIDRRWGTGYLKRLAAIAPAVPYSQATIAVYGKVTDCITVATMFPRNNIVARPLGGVSSRRRQRGMPPNIKFTTDAQVDAAVILGAIPDLQRVHGEKTPDEYVAGVLRTIRPEGYLVIRNTVAPDEAEALDLFTPSPRLRQLFERFVQSSAREPHIPPTLWQQVVPRDSNGTYQCPRIIWWEFQLKFPYLESNWEFERAKPYTVRSVAELEQLLQQHGFRINSGWAESNPWVYQQFYTDAFSVTDLQGRLLPLAPTTFVLQAQHVGSPEEAAPWQVRSITMEPSKKYFVTVRGYQSSQGAYREVAQRVSPWTTDIVPYAIHGGSTPELFVRVRVAQRPVALANQQQLDHRMVGSYFVEQLATIEQSGRPATSYAEAFKKLTTCSPAVVLQAQPARLVAPRLDTIAEICTTYALQVSREVLDGEQQVEHRIGSGGQPGSYELRTVEARRTLQGCASGVVRGGRLEVALYELLQAHQMSCGAWLGRPLSLTLQPDRIKLEHLSTVIGQVSPETWVEQTAAQTPGGNGDEAAPVAPQFLATYAGEFVTKGGARELAAEFIAPHASRPVSLNTFSVMPLAWTKKGIMVGLELRSLPAHSLVDQDGKMLVTIPTFRIPRSITVMREATQYVAQTLRRDFAIELMQIHSLGTRYLPSAGISPEQVFPMVAEVDVSRSDLSSTSLRWVLLEEALRHARQLCDLQTLVGLYRTAHALGVV